MKLKKLLLLQFLYYLAGILFNAVSIIGMSNGVQQLTPNEPYQGSIVMSIYAFFLLAGWYKKIPLYRILMVVSVLLLGYGGVVQHFIYIQSQPEAYLSIAAGVIGASINVFGLVLNVLAALGKFKVA